MAAVLVPEAKRPYPPESTFISMPFRLSERIPAADISVWKGLRHSRFPVSCSVYLAPGDMSS
jgi:hypothetical protein